MFVTSAEEVITCVCWLVGRCVGFLASLNTKTTQQVSLILGWSMGLSWE